MGIGGAELMPVEATQAIEWAKTQTDGEGNLVTTGNSHALVDKVREYFNANQITYSTFSYTDLLPYLAPQEPEQPDEPVL